MTSTRELHNRAMNLAELADASKRAGDETRSQELLQEAFELERQAAEQVESNLQAEPTRSVLLRSAASLALNCDRLREAERLIATALSGNPPAQIAEELRDLLEQVNFKRHLDLRGVELAPGEFQFSISGKSVGAGWTLSDAFVTRVISTERLVYRTAERLLGRVFRDRGGAERAIRENFALFLSPLRVGSLSVTFKLGRQKHPVLPGFDELFEEDRTGEVVEELVECLQLLNEANEEALRERMPDDAYYQNFVALAKQIAPDGEDVNQVGFTAVTGGVEKSVALRRPKEEITTVKPIHELVTSKDKTQRVTVKGQLLFADHRKAERGIIEIVETGGEGKTYKIIVPEGMMSDIVRPLWEYTVEVTGKRTGKVTIMLEDIRQAED
jgi:hypothetical protein